MTESSLIEQIIKMSPEEQVNLLQTFNDILGIKPLKKRGRPKGSTNKKSSKKAEKSLDEPQESAIIDTEDIPIIRTRGQDSGVRGRTNRGIPTTTQSIAIGPRKNLFMSRGLDKLHKEDSKVDKKLSGKNEVTERGSRHNLVQVECTECGSMETVNINVVYKDPEGNISFLCNKCSNKRSG